MEVGTGSWATGVAADVPLLTGNANWVEVTDQYSAAYLAGSIHWKSAQNLSHELAHGLGLGHLWWTPRDCYDVQNIKNSTTNNIMDHGGNQEAFTECQLSIIHANIMGAVGAGVPSNTAVPNFVVDDWCILDHSQDIHIIAGQNPIWEDKKYLAGDIYIDAGATLTIKCTLAMASGARIFVQKGNGFINAGVLVVDGGTITNICGSQWDGIRVEGVRAQPQTSVFQGKVELKNGATITNAIVGVKLGDGWAANGGIIVANDANFINNWKHVEFLSYSNPSNPTQNLSKLRNSLFECTGPLIGSTNGTGQFVSLWDVHGVTIVGNTFRNSAPPTAYANNSRGAGIYSIDADYYLGRSATTTITPAYTDYDAAACTLGLAAKPNIFDGLSTGVEYIWQNTTPNPIGLIALENEFKNITRGIICQEGKDAFIYKNKFTWDNLFIKDPNFVVPPSPSTIPFGIRMDFSTSFLIADNTFDWYRITQPGDNTPEVLGIHAISSYSSTSGSQINRNIIQNHAPYPNREYVIGNKFEFNNSNLDVQGNTYTDLSVDWYVRPDPSGSLKSPQGSPGNGNGAANQFTTCPNTTSSINFYLLPGASLTYYGNNNGFPFLNTCNVGAKHLY